jgi:hypothetical protein
LETLATLGYRPAENISQLKQRVSKIEFDKDEDFFALAGDLGEIQLFAYNPMDILSGAITQKQNEFVPLQYIAIPSMITDLSWSKHTRGQIASADVSGRSEQLLVYFEVAYLLTCAPLICGGIG